MQVPSIWDAGNVFRSRLPFGCLKNLPAVQETRVLSLGWEDPLRRKWPPTPVSLPGKSHGQRSLVGCSPRGRKEAGRAEHLLHFCLAVQVAAVWHPQEQRRRERILETHPPSLTRAAKEQLKFLPFVSCIGPFQSLRNWVHS